MESRHLIFDRALLAARRDRPTGIDDADFLLRHVAEDIAERLRFVRRAFPVVLDLGAGTGILGRRLASADIGVELIVSSDLSPRRLAKAAAPKVVADEELMPFRDGSLDLVV